MKKKQYQSTYGKSKDKSFALAFLERIWYQWKAILNSSWKNSWRSEVLFRINQFSSNNEIYICSIYRMRVWFARWEFEFKFKVFAFCKNNFGKKKSSSFIQYMRLKTEKSSWKLLFNCLINVLSWRTMQTFLKLFDRKISPIILSSFLFCKLKLKMDIVRSFFLSVSLMKS